MGSSDTWDGKETFVLKEGRRADYAGGRDENMKMVNRTEKDGQGQKRENQKTGARGRV